MKNFCTFVFLIATVVSLRAQADSLEKLSNDFWTWRAKHAPFTGDDVNRIERPGGTRDWSRSSIDQRRNDLEHFEARWKKIDVTEWPVPKQVDYRLIGSALSRMRWATTRPMSAAGSASIRSSTSIPSAR